MKKNKKQHLFKEHLRNTVEIQFNNIGVKCPFCGYVYKNGMSGVTEAMEKTLQRKTAAPKDERAHTVCTRCYEPLVVETGNLRGLSLDEKLALTPTDIEGLEILRKFLKEMKVHSEN